MTGNFAIVNENGLCIPKGTIVRVVEVDSEAKLPEKGLVGCARCVAINDPCLSGGIWCAYLAPIPLSVEILEKHFTGAIEGCGGLMRINYNLNEKSFIQVFAGGFYFCVRVDDSEHCFHDEICVKTLEWVHQLQNIFSVLGFKKEITLDGIDVNAKNM